MTTYSVSHALGILMITVPADTSSGGAQEYRDKSKRPVQHYWQGEEENYGEVSADYVSRH